VNARCKTRNGATSIASNSKLDCASSLGSGTSPQLPLLNAPMATNRPPIQPILLNQTFKDSERLCPVWFQKLKKTTLAAAVNPMRLAAAGTIKMPSVRQAPAAI
jgi:hypothetical protein